MQRLSTKYKITPMVVAIGILAAVCLASFGSLQKASAATGSMYMTSSASSVLNGNQFTVFVRANAAAANAAQLDITYPSSTLDLMSYSTSGSVMPTLVQAPTASEGNFGAVIYAGGGGTPLTGDSLLMSLVFQAKAGSGTAAINLSPSSKLVNAGSQVSTSYSGATVTLTSPAPPPAAAPIISDFKPSASSVVAGNTVTLTWAVSNSVSCSVTPGGPTNTSATSWTTPKLTKIGIEGSTFKLICQNSDGVSSAAKEVSVSVSAIPIAPSSVKATPTASASPQASPTPEVKGASTYSPPVSLTPTVDSKVGLVESTTMIIKDKTGKPLANVEVVFDGTNGKVFKTDKDGKVVITNVPAGKLTMSVRSGGKEISKQDITLVAGVTDTAQQVKLAGVSSGSSKNGLIIMVAAVILAILLVLAAVIIIKKRKQPKPIVLANPAEALLAQPINNPVVSQPVNPVTQPNQVISADNLDAASANSAKIIVDNENSPVAETSEP